MPRRELRRGIMTTADIIVEFRRLLDAVKQELDLGESTRLADAYDDARQAIEAFETEGYILTTPARYDPNIVHSMPSPDLSKFDELLRREGIEFARTEDTMWTRICDIARVKALYEEWQRDHARPL